MIISCNTIVDRRDHAQYLTVSKSYSDKITDMIVNWTEYNIKKIYIMVWYKCKTKHDFKNSN